MARPYPPLSKEQLDLLQDLYVVQDKSLAEVLSILGITERQFRQAKKSLGFSKRAPYQRLDDFWLQHSKQELTDYYQNHSFKDTAKHFSLTDANLKHLCHELNLRHAEDQKTQFRQFTCRQLYGVPNATDREEARSRSHSPEAVQKMLATAAQNNMQKYGVPYSVLRPEVKEKARKTNLQRYGAANWLATEEGRQFTRTLHRDPNFQARTTATKKISWQSEHLSA